MRDVAAVEPEIGRQRDNPAASVHGRSSPSKGCGNRAVGRARAESALARLQEIRDQRIALDHQERALHAFLAAMEAA